MKFKEIKTLNKEQREKKIKELKLELIKSKSANSKTTGKSKVIRKIIARILTFNAQEGGLKTK
ncbi:50S ribosomal protein L29 [archaeon]|jgi:ribosomal protein L29|nr:50S ribosomal protein L29 [archaeon]